ncbi:MAG: membrane integrity-associated transporter subunit PqiC [Deltaproteobacteria bacterium]|nr:membrane integrity-associated transporter subunit PqiC [Deltaproteobacteria bacterium]
MKGRTSLTFSVIMVVFICLTGCVKLEKSYPDKHFYALDITRPRSDAGPQVGPVLLVRTITVSPRYDAKDFVYRQAELTYQSDFYNEFFLSPGMMVTEVVRNWMTASGMFQNVVDTPGYVTPNYVLEGAVNSIYGDYRNSQAPHAVLEMQFFLVQSLEGKTPIVFQKQYRQSVALTTETPQALARGWNDGLTRILTELEQDMKTKLLSPSHAKD